jgi:hypothetical protein
MFVPESVEVIHFRALRSIPYAFSLTLSNSLSHPVGSWCQMPEFLLMEDPVTRHVKHSRFAAQRRLNNFSSFHPPREVTK